MFVVVSGKVTDLTSALAPVKGKAVAMTRRNAKGQLALTRLLIASRIVGYRQTDKPAMHTCKQPSSQSSQLAALGWRSKTIKGAVGATVESKFRQLVRSWQWNVSRSQKWVVIDCHSKDVDGRTGWPNGWRRVEWCAEVFAAFPHCRLTELAKLHLDYN